MFMYVFVCQSHDFSLTDEVLGGEEVDDILLRWHRHRCIPSDFSFFGEANPFCDDKTKAQYDPSYVKTGMNINIPLQHVEAYDFVFLCL